MFKWMDRVYVNARKKIFKNLDTGEILNLEIQDDPDNIKQDSETPITAHCLNLAQQELIDDLGKTYKGTNITAPTVAGYGRINRSYGSAFNDVNLFNATLEIGSISGGDGTNVNSTTRVRTSDYITLDKGTYTISYHGANACGCAKYDTSNNYVKELYSWTSGRVTFTLDEKCNLRFTFKINDETTIVPSSVYDIKLQKGSVATSYSPYGYCSIEVISQDGENKSSNICYVKNGLNEEDYIDYKLGKVVRANGTTENVLNCSDKIIQYADSTNVYNTDGAEIEVSLTNNETVSELNENIKKVEDIEKIKVEEIDISNMKTSNVTQILRAKIRKYGHVHHINICCTSSKANQALFIVPIKPAETTELNVVGNGKSTGRAVLDQNGNITTELTGQLYINGIVLI